MIGRRTVWSANDVKKLLKDFIPCGDEVWRLHHGTDAECKLFQMFCEEGHYGTKTGGTPNSTRQGTYCCTPSGMFLGSVNSNDSGRICELLRTSLVKYQAIDKKERLQAKDPAPERKNLQRAEAKYPEDGLILRVHSRDLERKGGKREEEWAEKAHNVDFAWFTKEELQNFLPKSFEKKATFEVPRELLVRLARLHFADNVRGQTDPYAVEAVEKIELKGTVKDLKKGLVIIDFEGELKLKDATRLFEGRLRGTASWDTRKNVFTVFELIAAGDRTGQTRYNFRQNDLGPAPIGFCCVMAGDVPSDKIAPAHLGGYGWR